MRLDFNVLWVDDQPEHVAAQIKGIAKRMDEEGFHFKPKLCKTIEDVQKVIKDDVFTDEIDLILVDWELEGGAQGQDAMTVIREIVHYRDIVFYSAQNDVAALKKLAYERGIEGIYCATRQDLIEEVLGVFDSLVKKVLDLDHTRGIVMGATSDIDQMVKDCLIAIHGKLDDAGKKAMLEEALQRIDKKLKDLDKQIKKLKTATTVMDVFEAHHAFTANDRLRMLKDLLKQETFKSYSEASVTVGRYIDEVVPERNSLGHLVLVPAGKAQAVVNVEGKELSLDEAKQLRKLILDLRGDFRTLLLALQAKETSVSTASASSIE